MRDQSFAMHVCNHIQKRNHNQDHTALFLQAQLCDFVVIHSQPPAPSSLHFTLTTSAGRVYVSQSLLSSTAVPRLADIWHVSARDPLVAPCFMSGGEYVRRPSDHAAVALRLAFSAHPRAPQRWTLDAGLLLQPELLERLRRIVVQHVTAERVGVRKDGAAA